MSYILDALKKAERERGVARVPTLMTVHDFRAVRKNYLWAVLLAGMVLVVAGTWLVVNLRSSRVPLSSPSVTGAERTQPENRSEVGRLEDNPSQKGSAPALPAQKTETPKSAPATEKAELKRASESRLVSRPIPVTSLSEAAGTAGQSLPDQILAAAGRPEPSSAAGALGTSGGTPAPPANQAKPASLREAMSKMNMSVLVFADSKADRMVYINGRKYAEGDYIEGQYLLESITADGAVLSFEGERVLLHPGSR
jgi:general secretion pathway protein B